MTSPALRVAESIGAHLGAVFAGDVFEQRAENLHGDIARQEIGQDLAFVGLVFIDDIAHGRAASSTGAGISCCAVGTWLMTERKRE